MFLSLVPQFFLSPSLIFVPLWCTQYCPKVFFLIGEQLLTTPHTIHEQPSPLQPPLLKPKYTQNPNPPFPPSSEYSYSPFTSTQFFAYLVNVCFYSPMEAFGPVICFPTNFPIFPPFVSPMLHFLISESSVYLSRLLYALRTPLELVA